MNVMSWSSCPPRKCNKKAQPKSPVGARLRLRLAGRPNASLDKGGCAEHPYLCRTASKYPQNRKGNGHTVPCQESARSAPDRGYTAKMATPAPHKFAGLRSCWPPRSAPVVVALLFLNHRPEVAASWARRQPSLTPSKSNTRQPDDHWQRDCPRRRGTPVRPAYAGPAAGESWIRLLTTASS